MVHSAASGLNTIARHYRRYLRERKSIRAVVPVLVVPVEVSFPTEFAGVLVLRFDINRREFVGARHVGRELEKLLRESDV